MKTLFEHAVRIITIGFSLLLASLNVQADAAHKLQEKLQNISSYKASFTQEIRDEFNTVLDSSSGHFELQRPKQFRWVVTDPYEQEIVADGKSLWQFDRDIEQINVSELDASLETTPAAILTKDQVDIVDNYNVAEITTSSDDTTLFQLSSTAEDALFERLLMEFKGESLIALQVSDNLGQTTLIEFTDVNLAPDFEQQHFVFTPPEGVDVIDNRQKVADNAKDKP
ncbi:outer membrane lipoprotein chaperone LolA [Kangiella marina]|uniref:Outer-membrane lipoprotein carrier protein n=1 Tax=Kangiella marina TaxID=1079178 RepID=A0ABP8I9Q9_9GAMM